MIGLHRVRDLLQDQLVEEVGGRIPCKSIKTLGAAVMEVLQELHHLLQGEVEFDLQSSMIRELKELMGVIALIKKNRMKNLRIRRIGGLSWGIHGRSGSQNPVSAFTEGESAEDCGMPTECKDTQCVERARGQCRVDGA